MSADSGFTRNSLTRLTIADGRRAIRKQFTERRSYEAEREALSLVEGAALVAPTLIEECGDDETLCVCMTEIDGQTLDSAMFRSEASGIGELIGTLHQVTRGRYSASTKLRVRDRAYVRAEAASIDHQLARLAADRFDDWREYLEVPLADMVLVHRDVRSGNVMRCNSGVQPLVLLDFEHSVWGAAEGDFARLMVLELPERNEQAVARDAYEERTGRRLDDTSLQAHSLAFCVEMLAWIERTQEKLSHPATLTSTLEEAMIEILSGQR